MGLETLEAPPSSTFLRRLNLLCEGEAVQSVPGGPNTGGMNARMSPPSHDGAVLGNTSCIMPAWLTRQT